MSLGSAFAADTIHGRSPMSPYFETIIKALLQVSSRSNNDANCRTSAYECIASLFQTASVDCYSVIYNATQVCIDRLETTLVMQVCMFEIFS